MFWAMFAFVWLGVLHVIELYGFEFFQLFFGENFVECFDALNSVVEQSFLSFENICFGCCDFLVVVSVKCFAEGFFSFLLLFAKILERRIHHAALLFQSGLLFRSNLQHGIHEGFAFFEVEFLIELFIELLVEMLAIEVLAFKVWATRRFSTEMFAMFFATVAFFLATVHILFAAIARLEFANSAFRT